LTDPLTSYQQRIYAKTASLFEVATEGAALLSDSSAEVVEAMKSFGYYIGMAFQIVDDLLDFTGNPDDVGKPVGSDLRQGLITLPAIYYLEVQPDKEIVVNKIATNAFSESEFDDLIEGIRESDGISRSLDQAERYVEQGLKHLEDLPATLEREGLSELARYIITRST
jgi:geranylgeranyl pyrophosphate synthase